MRIDSSLIHMCFVTACLSRYTDAPTQGAAQTCLYLFERTDTALQFLVFHCTIRIEILVVGFMTKLKNL